MASRPIGECINGLDNGVEGLVVSMKSTRQAAVALEYTPGADAVPRVSAQGRGILADRIIEEAKRAGVPIRKDRNLVELLMQFDVDQHIPSDLYQAVAELLVFLYRLDAQWLREHGFQAASSSSGGPTT